MVVTVIISAADPACACYDLGLTARITSRRERTSRQTGLGNPADRQEVESWGYRPSSQAPPAFRGCELYKGAPGSGHRHPQQLSQHLCVPCFLSIAWLYPSSSHTGAHSPFTNLRLPTLKSLLRSVQSSQVPHLSLPASLTVTTSLSLPCSLSSHSPHKVPL